MRKLKSLFLWIPGGLFFLVCVVILVPCLFVLPKEKTFSTARFLFRILIRIMGIRLVVEGQQHIDPGRSYLIMGNHQSLFDVFVIPSAIPLCFIGVEAAYHFSLPVWGFLVRKWGCIPIERNNLQSAIKSLETAKKEIRSGMNIGILPEGHRTRTGEIAPFKKGPFHLAKGAGADILPFAIIGLFDYCPRGSFILKPGTVTVRIGKPIEYEAFKNLSVQDIRSHVFDRILSLSRGGRL